ncbi:MAG: hypothetical protein AAFU83_04580, partial [Bacteroidota bacterium]
SFIDHYWETKDRVCIAILVPRLYEAALTVEDTEEPCQQELVLRSTKGDVVEAWDKTKEGLESFKQLIRSTPPYFKQ